MSLRLLAPTVLALSLAACSASNADGSEDVGVFDLAVGDCLIDETEGELSETVKIACDKPHLSEVYHLFDLPGGAFPERGAMDKAIEAGCLSAFEPYVGLDYDSSEYAFTTLEPTPESWADGDQEVVCMLTTQDGSEITGSLRDAKR